MASLTYTSATCEVLVLWFQTYCKFFFSQSQKLLFSVSSTAVYPVLKYFSVFHHQCLIINFEQ